MMGKTCKFIFYQIFFSRDFFFLPDFFFSQEIAPDLWKPRLREKKNCPDSEKNSATEATHLCGESLGSWNIGTSQWRYLTGITRYPRQNAYSVVLIYTIQVPCWNVSLMLLNFSQCIQFRECVENSTAIISARGVSGVLRRLVGLLIKDH